ncbi:MAG: hypothetical protein ACR2JC_12045 [Chloroflexota bacterium]
MADTKLNRKQILAGVGAAGIAAALASPASALAAGDSGVTGTWLLTVKTSGAGAPPPSLNLVSFAAGGVVVVVNSTDQQPRTRGTAQLGAWEANGDDFRAKVLQFALDNSGNPVAIVRVSPVGERDPGSDSIHGTFTGTVRDFQGHLLASLSGTFSGTRVTVDGAD